MENQNVKIHSRFGNSLLMALFVTVTFSACSPGEKPDRSLETEHYMITPLNLRHVKLTDRFWLPIVQRIQDKTIPYALEKCRKEGRLDNFLIAGGHMEGSVKGKMPFDDTDVYKIIEGASMSLISAPNPELEKELDHIIEIIGKGQEADGYLTTWRTINPKKPPAPWVNVVEGKRWESLEASHELYNAGHLYEAAYAHYKATGKENFLKIAYRNADLIVKTFGSEEGQVAAVPGHQIIETGLIKLYYTSGKEEYLRLAKYFLDNRGRPEHHDLNESYLSAAYSQDHLPVIEQDEVLGHAVRAMYMVAAMTDIAVLMNDVDYEKAVDKLWHNMVEEKIYLTGGIGASREGEAFGKNYELPNLTAYNETCAAIGSVCWNHRLHSKTGQVQYLDLMERTLYNGLLAGLSLDGTHFFYPNPLESDGEYAFNQGAQTRKDWFDCSCCPTNLIRFLPSVAGLLYSISGDTLYVNLYAGSEARVPLENTLLEIQQETRYPWDGVVNIRVSSTKDVPAVLKLRVPSWARNNVLPGDLYTYLEQNENSTIVRINGEEIRPLVMDGYMVLERAWKEDEISLEFPMAPRKVVADSRVAEDRGKTALEYGPLVYAFEGVDQKEDMDRLRIGPSESFIPKMENELLGGVVTLSSEKAKAIPYYSWSNRGVGKMKVWIPLEKELAMETTYENLLEWFENYFDEINKYQGDLKTVPKLKKFFAPDLELTMYSILSSEPREPMTRDALLMSFVHPGLQEDLIPRYYSVDVKQLIVFVHFEIRFSDKPSGKTWDPLQASAHYHLTVDENKDLKIRKINYWTEPLPEDLFEYWTKRRDEALADYAMDYLNSPR